MDANLMTPLDQFVSQPGGTPNLGAQTEERGPPPQGLERVQDWRGGLRIRAVVEGEGDMTGVTDAGEAGKQAAPHRPPSDHTRQEMGDDAHPHGADPDAQLP
jgi:hypothetical protein